MKIQPVHYIPMWLTGHITHVAELLTTLEDYAEQFSQLT